MTSDEARAILDEARETLERTADITVRQRDYSTPDALEEWRRNMPLKPEAPRALTAAEIEAVVRREVAAAVSAAMAEHKMLADARQEAIGRALGEVRKQLREEIVAAVGELRADLTIEKAHAGDRTTVIDLPAVLPRDRRAG